MPDGATCFAATGTACYANGTGYASQNCNYVSACVYQISGGTDNLLNVSGLKYYIVDNIEMLGICNESQGSPNFVVQGNDTYVRYGSMCNSGCSGGVPPLALENLYIHGSSHPQFGVQNGQNCAGVYCFNNFAFQGGVNNSSVGETIVNNVVDFADSDPIGEGLCFSGFYNVAYNVFRYTTQCAPGGANGLHLFHDNLYEYFFENGHSNMIEGIPDNPTTANAIYNNVFRHVEAGITSGGGVFLWFSPPCNTGISSYGCNGSTITTDYIFNNVGYDIGNLEYLNIGGTAGSNANGPYTFFNNTWQSNYSQVIIRCSGYTAAAVNDTNEHYIDDTSTPIGTGCSTQVSTTNLCQSNTSGGTTTACPTYSDANVTPKFDQYTSSETYAYSPLASTNSTVGVGTNETGGYCAALATAGLSAAATACKSATTYACFYNTSTHVNTCPATTANTRPSSGAWDVGTYEYTASSGPGFQYSPSPVAFGLINDGSSSSPITVTITNDGTSGTLNIGTLGSPSDAEYAISSNTCNGQNLAVNATCTFVVTFSPTSAGSKPATISVPDNVGNPDTINLTGTGVATGPIVSLSPTTLVFGSQVLNVTSGGQTTTLTNTGNATLNIVSIATNNSQYVKSSTTCGSTLAATSSCTVSVTFTPNALGSQNYSLIFTTNATSSPDSVALQGTGIPIGYISGGCSTSAILTGASNTPTFSCTPARTGDAVLFAVDCHPSSGTITAITLTATGWTNSTQLIAPLGNTTGNVSALFGFIAPNTSSATFTVSFTGSGVSDCSNFGTVLGGEFQGNSTVGGTTTFAAVGSSAGASGQCSTSVSNVTAANNDSVWFACVDTALGALTPYAVGVNDTADDLSEYRLGVTPAAYTPSFDSGGSYIVMGAAIAPAGVTNSSPAAWFMAGNFLVEGDAR
jgi:hypothetical protein